MLPAGFPLFRYHPDPIASGSVEATDDPCYCCGKRRGYVYTAGIYGYPPEDLEEALCPWCIADGSARAKWDLSFNAIDRPSGLGDWDSVPEAVIDELEFRTPGWSGWQENYWWAHCNDAAAFLKPVGQAEVESLGPELVEAFRQNAGLSGADWQEYFSQMGVDGNPTGYLFRCLQCGKYGGYSDYL